MVKHITEDKALELLRKYSTSEKDFQVVVEHSRAVQKIALRVAEGVEDIDMDFIRTACLLHDIGRFDYPPGSPESNKHGLRGSEILKEENLPDHARVARTHLGCGITRDDIKRHNLPFPDEDFIPETNEELIIAYADNLTNHDKEMDENWVEDRFSRELGEEFRERFREFHNRIHKLITIRK